MIRNIIFDLGGVIYDIDHNMSKLAFERLGVEDFDQLFSHQVQTGIFRRLETGDIPEEEFISYLAGFLPENTSKEEIVDAWCALLVGTDFERLKLLQSLKKNYKLFLLSNTNIIHYKKFIRELNTDLDFKTLFTDVWFSHERGMRKPDIEIYQSLMREHHLIPGETLFIDDLDKNIEAAEKLGIKTHFLQNENILDLFENAKWISD